MGVFSWLFLLPHWRSYVFVKIFIFEILVSEYSEPSKTSRNMILSWRPDVCVCVRVCPIFNVSNPDNSWMAWDIDMKFGTPVKQSQPFNRDYFHDNWCTICDFMRFWFDFRRIRAFVLKLHTNILYRSRNFGIEFGQNRLKRSNFFRFWIFWEFFHNCLTQANFNLSSWNFVGKCTNTKWCLIPDFIRISGDL